MKEFIFWVPLAEFSMRAAEMWAAVKRMPPRIKVFLVPN